jgi:peptide/nickel transport system permease protein
MLNRLSDTYKVIQPSFRELQISFYLLNRNTLQRISLMVISLLVAVAVFAPWIAPYPSHALTETNPQDKLLPPSARYLMGTDE